MDGRFSVVLFVLLVVGGVLFIRLALSGELDKMIRQWRKKRKRAAIRRRVRRLKRQSKNRSEALRAFCQELQRACHV